MRFSPWIVILVSALWLASHGRTLAPLAPALLVLGILEGLTAWARRAVPPQPVNPEAARILRDFNLDSMSQLGLLTACGFGVGSVLMAVDPQWIGAFTAVGAVAFLGTVALIIARHMRMVDRLESLGLTQELRGYGRLLYANPDDPRLWVPKLSGFGTTLNFAHPWAWPVFLAILAFPIGVLVVVGFQALQRL